MALILQILRAGTPGPDGSAAPPVLRDIRLEPNNTQASRRLVRRRLKRQRGPGVGASVENPYSKDYLD